jgi:anti-sigma regulatory factor (Ser/Thr protein kinase)
MTAAQDQRQTVRTFPSRPAAVRAARQFVVDRLAGDHAADTAALLVSELATNAVEHARTPFTVRVVVGPTVRVEVGDRSNASPVALEVPSEADRGRGLGIVAALASRWGTSHTAEGKVVWFELPAGAGPTYLR